MLPNTQAAEKAVVLVVDDEAILRMTTVDLVEEAGFDALEAVDADEAVRIMEARRDVRVMLTDVDMPGSMDGVALAACVRDRWPSIEIIMVSGKVRLRAQDIPARGLFFSKPYDSEHVVAALHRFTR